MNNNYLNKINNTIKIYENNKNNLIKVLHLSLELLRNIKIIKTNKYYDRFIKTIYNVSKIYYNNQNIFKKDYKNTNEYYNDLKYMNNIYKIIFSKLYCNFNNLKYEIINKYIKIYEEFKNNIDEIDKILCNNYIY